MLFFKAWGEDLRTFGGVWYSLKALISISSKWENLKRENAKF
jgi:hypothetical protein